MNAEIISIPVLSVSQCIGDFYAGVIGARDLLFVSNADRLRLTNLKVPKYAGFQRALDPDRVRDIRSYLSTPRSTFPNAIIINVDSDYLTNWRNIKRQKDISILRLRRDHDAVQIIDGQHRVAALDAVESDFTVIVSVFIDLELFRCAEIFAKINSTQKAVNPSIAFQLFGYAEDRSPQKTAHDIAETLNNTGGSPFYRQLRMLGTKDEWSIGTLSQSTFSKYLMRLYTPNPAEDENRLLRSQSLDPNVKYPLRESFIAQDDKRILSTIWNYFFGIADTWPKQWYDESGGSILLKTTGYSAMIEVLKRLLLSNKSGEVETKDKVIELFSPLRSKYEQREHRFTRRNYPAGNQGVITLRDALLADLGL